MPFRHEGVVSISQRVGASDRPSVSIMDLGDLAGGGGAFRRTAACTLYTGDVNAWFLRGEATRKVIPALVSGNFFRLFDVKPVLGGDFFESNEPQVILSERVWRKHYGGNPDIIGKLTGLNNEEYTVAGVAPDGFDVPQGADVWVRAPLFSGTFTPYRTNRLFYGFGRLSGSMTLAAAQRQADLVSKRLEQQYPASNRKAEFVVRPLLEGLDGRLMAVTRVLKILVIGLFAVASINLVLLLFARSWDRRGELAVRLAFGAEWRHIFAEAARSFATWTISGSLLGCLVGAALLRTVTAVARDLLPRYVKPSIHWPAAAFCFAVTLLLALQWQRIWRRSYAQFRRRMGCSTARRARALAGGPNRFFGACSLSRSP